MTPSEWTVPPVTRGEVDRAGRLLAQNGGLANVLLLGRALDVVNHWRSAHSFPLSTLQMRLRKRVRHLDLPGVTVAQRLKRTPSILAKLRRFPSRRGG